MLVCGQEFTEEIVGKVRDMVGTNPTISRRDLSLKVCDWLDWKRPNGELGEMSCRVALLKLQRQGIIELPQPGACAFRRAKGTGREVFVPEIGPVCCQLKELGSIELVRIDSRWSKLSKIWNNLMDRYHYLGAGPLCGAQLRYLIKSPHHGWLGGLAFSAAAWRLAPREGLAGARRRAGSICPRW